MIQRSLRAAAACFLLATAAPLVAHAQTAGLHGVDVDAGQDTGWIANPGSSEAVTAWFVAEAPAAPWVRLHFGLVELDGDPRTGPATELRLTSLRDLAVQVLDARTIEEWQRTSAYFNGGAVLVELVAPAGAGPSRVRLDTIHAGVANFPEETICGATDDRQLSSDPRAARVVPVGCTVWLIDDCAKCFLTAGHCAGTSLQVVQFNVPLSTSGGSIQHPPPSDQYAVDVASKQSASGGVGNDWGYFGVFPNSTTGLSPFQAQGQAFTLAPPPPFSAADAIRITGYGTDNTPPEWNQVQQTHTGPWNSATTNALNYAADTTGGNSGSPVIHEPTGIAIGIHTHGGCSSTPGTGNNGTAASQAAFQAALAAPRGVCAAGIEHDGTPPAAIAPGTVTLVQMRAITPIVAGTAELRWRANAGASFASIPMSDLGGGLYSAALPPFACDDAPEYSFAAMTFSCGPVTSPEDAPNSTYRPEVGVAVPIFVDDFQTDLGWSVSDGPGLTSGTWERGVPANGNRGDPPADADGSGSCYVTENVAGNSDVDGGTTFLVSPVLDLTGGARIEYRYWLGSTGSIGVEDGMLVQVATNAAGTNWTSLRNYTTPELAWRFDRIEVGVEIPATSTVRVRVSITDSDPGHVVEGGFDAFTVVRFACGSLPQVFCAGDGSATACPCGNAGGAGRGCANSFDPAGARLSASGTSSVSADTLTLDAEGLPLATTALFFQGDAQQAGGAGAVFGDGLRCAAGVVVRLGTRGTTAGTASFGANVPGDPSVSAAGLVPAGGGLRHYQVWYRNAADFCTSATFNLSNGLSITWGA